MMKVKTFRNLKFFLISNDSSCTGLKVKKNLKNLIDELDKFGFSCAFGCIIALN